MSTRAATETTTATPATLALCFGVQGAWEGCGRQEDGAVKFLEEDLDVERRGLKVRWPVHRGLAHVIDLGLGLEIFIRGRGNTGNDVVWILKLAG